MHPRSPHHRPPWWPEDEAWPPERWQRGPWRHGPRPFVRWFGCLFIAIALFAIAVVVMVGWMTGMVHGTMGQHPGPAGPPRWGAFPFLLVLLIVVYFGVRSFRRFVEPLSNLVDAARRVEAGDYLVQVPAPRRGPPELHALVRAFNTMTQRLQADEQARRSLLADVSHELRTPLAVIQGEVEAMIDGVHPADEGHLGGLLDEVQVLSRLVDDLRTLVLSQGGTLALHREPTDLAVLIQSVAEAFRPAAEDGQVSLSVETPDDLPLLEVDPIRVRQVLENLTANALRYTPSGGNVRITATHDAAGVRMTVTDTGAGIDPDILPHIFDRFVKGAGSRGSGLGLAIARSLVEAHGGTIAAESAKGQGTRVTVTLPVGEGIVRRRVE